MRSLLASGRVFLRDTTSWKKNQHHPFQKWINDSTTLNPPVFRKKTDLFRTCQGPAEEEGNSKTSKNTMAMWLQVGGFFPPIWKILPSLKLTWHLKITPWKRRFLLETIIFRGYVSFRECSQIGSWNPNFRDENKTCLKPPTPMFCFGLNMSVVGLLGCKSTLTSMLFGKNVKPQDIFSQIGGEFNGDLPW